jgi:hypothetical protein
MVFSGLAFAKQTADAQQENQTTNGSIPIVGSIQNPVLFDLAREIEDEFLSGDTTADDVTKTATAILAYIGKDIVSDGKFVAPEGAIIPAPQLSILMSKTFPEEGCRIERLTFSSSGDYVVLLVDSSENPEIQYIEQCLLVAALTAHGRDLTGVPVMPVDDLRALLATQ